MQVSATSESTAFIGTANLGLNSGVWLVTPHENGESKLYEVYHVAEGYPIRHNLLGGWKGRGQLEMTQTAKPLRRRDLEGTTIRAGVLEASRAFSKLDELFSFSLLLQRNIKKDTNKLLGYFPSIWLQLEDLLNFRTQVLR